MHIWRLIPEKQLMQKPAMPMGTHTLQADIPGMGWVKTFLFHVWALPSLMFLLQSWSNGAAGVNARALSGRSKRPAGAQRVVRVRVAEPSPGSQSRY